MHALHPTHAGLFSIPRQARHLATHALHNAGHLSTHLTTSLPFPNALKGRQSTSRRKGPPRRSAAGGAEATPWLPAQLGCGAGLAGVQAPAARLAAMLTSWEQPPQLVTVVGPPGIGA